MTNKEKYKQAFSVLRPSGKLSLEVEDMMLNNKKARLRTAIAAVAACLLLAGGSGAAYAANVGGIQRTIQLWIHGDQTNVDFKYNVDGTYDMSYQNGDGLLEEHSGGGVSVDQDGKEQSSFGYMATRPTRTFNITGTEPTTCLIRTTTEPWKNTAEEELRLIKTEKNGL